MTRWDRVRASVSAAAFLGSLSLLPACSGVRVGPGAPTDGGAASDASGGFVDAGLPPARAGEYDDAAGLDGARGGCFDGEDNDSDGRSDCDDRSCQENVPSCCVGTSSDVCCPAQPIAALDLSACATSLAACLSPAASLFGAPSPSIRADGGQISLLPGGFESDSGVLLSPPMDPRAGARSIEADIASPLTAPLADRVESIAVGFVDAGITPEMISRVAPVAAVIVSRNRQEVMLSLLGEIVQRWPLTTDMPVRYTLEIDPAGQVRLTTTPDILHTTRPLAVSGLVRALVYGRTVNASGAELPARLLSFAVSGTRCDMPGALARGPGAVVPAPSEDTSWADAISTIAEPDVLRYGDGVVRMALMVDGEVHLARPGGGGFTLLSSPGTPALPPPADPWAADGVSDPALAHEGGQLVLYFTGWSGGRGTIGRAVYDEGTGRFAEAAAVQGLAATAEAHYSAAAPLLIEATRHMLVRVDGPSGHRLALFALNDTSGARELVTVRAPNADDTFAFDHDEVDAPAVVRRDGVYRAYFSGRRGTRWSIGVVVSDDGTHWRDPTPGAVLAGRGEGFDALSVRDPAIDIVDGTLHLYYTGADGVVERVGAATAP